MVKKWIIDWFAENSAINTEEIKLKTSESYFENQWLDSYAFINFVSDIEKEFSISFSNDEFQDRKFSTIDGLTEIIEEKING